MADTKTQKSFDAGYKDGLKAYKDREGSSVEKFVTEKITDPLDKLMSGDKDKEYVDGFKKAREEKLGFKKGGAVKESKKMVKKEVAFMKKKGAPKSMIKHEMAEAKGMKTGGKVKCMASGGSASKRADGCAIKGKTRGKMV